MLADRLNAQNRTKEDTKMDLARKTGNLDLYGMFFGPEADGFREVPDMN